jgi:hypothetical protein
MGPAGAPVSRTETPGPPPARRPVPYPRERLRDTKGITDAPRRVVGVRTRPGGADP